MIIKKKLRVGLLGYGTVGQGCLQLLQTNAAEIAHRYHCEFHIEKILIHDKQKPRVHYSFNPEFTTQPSEIIGNPAIDVVIELIGGVTPAFDFVRQALMHHQHVITANKALLAERGEELFQLAAEKNCFLRFEAAVAGGVPIICALEQGLSANQITRMAGIINGTSNYILSALAQQKADFTQVLQQAQQLGYAEADPTLDIDGSDIAHKLCLLAHLAFGAPLAMNTIFKQGISEINALDLHYARELGFCIKQLGIAEKTDHHLLLRVQPCLIPDSSLLAHVNGAMNAILVEANAAGPTIYYGQGAGALPTASSVIADLITIATQHYSMQVPKSAISSINFLTMDSLQSEFYLRFHVRDEAGVLARMTQSFAKMGISIESLLQKKSDHQHDRVPIIIKTHQVNYQNLQQAISEIKQHPTVAKQSLCLPIVKI
ncbi:MAG: homoserine dehydrogenase [Legionellales bacterium]|nr:homoserine dehydrogenase [Legionellales bacterium]